MRRILVASAASLLPSLALAQQCPVADAPQQAVPPAQAHAPRVPTPEEIKLPRLRPGQDGGNKALATLLASPVEVYDIGSAFGMRGVWALNREKATHQPMYFLPNGEGVFAGRAITTGQRELTVEALKHVPGLFPSAEVKGTPQQAVARIPQMTGRDALEAVDDTASGLVGSNKVPRLAMFFDPLCPWSAKAFEELQPAVEAGRVQLALVPVPMLDPTGTKGSTAATRQLVGSDMAMEQVWPAIKAGRTVPFDAEAAESRLEQNWQAARRIGIPSSPTFVFKDKEGNARTFSGAGGAETMLTAMGR